MRPGGGPLNSVRVPLCGSGPPLREEEALDTAGTEWAECLAFSLPWRGQGTAGCAGQCETYHHGTWDSRPGDRRLCGRQNLLSRLPLGCGSLRQDPLWDASRGLRERKQGNVDLRVPRHPHLLAGTCTRTGFRVPSASPQEEGSKHRAGCASAMGMQSALVRSQGSLPFCPFPQATGAQRGRGTFPGQRSGPCASCFISPAVS